MSAVFIDGKSKSLRTVNIDEKEDICHLLGCKPFSTSPNYDNFEENSDIAGYLIWTSGNDGVESLDALYFIEGAGGFVGNAIIQKLDDDGNSDHTDIEEVRKRVLFYDPPPLKYARPLPGEESKWTT